jgi:predicted MFS family arabinose efflux permease
VQTLTPRLTFIMAAACGLAVANLYYHQPLLADIAARFGVDQGRMGLVSTATQLGYAAGMLAFVPLADLLERRRLIVLLMAAVTGSLVLAALAPSLPLLAAASFVVGLTTVAPQILIPLAAAVAAPERRGKVIGALYTGLLLGILLARTASGFIGDRFGWRSAFWAPAAISLLTGAVLAKTLPLSRPRETLRYRDLLASLATLLRQHPELREASLVGGLVFAAFSAFWTTLAFLLAGHPYHLGPRAAGLFGLIGATGALVAPVAGRLADKRGPRFVVGCAIAAAIFAYLVLLPGAAHLAALVLGVILLDAGVQAAQVTNQTRIFALAPAAQGRMNTLYMIAYFSGGAVGSFAGSAAWRLAGWPGVCTAGLTLLALAATLRTTAHLRANPRTPINPQTSREPFPARERFQ